MTVLKKKVKKSTLSIKRDCVNQDTPILKSSRPVFLGLRRAVMRACDEISLVCAGFFHLDSTPLRADGFVVASLFHLFLSRHRANNSIW